MAKTYMFRVMGNDQYKVMRIDDKLPKGKRYEEYDIDLNGSDWLCSCPGFMYRKKCKHIKFLVSQLMDKGGILDFQHQGDYDKLFEAAKNQKL